MRGYDCKVDVTHFILVLMSRIGELLSNLYLWSSLSPDEQVALSPYYEHESDGYHILKPTACVEVIDILHSVFRIVTLLMTAKPVGQMQAEMQAALCDPSLLHDGPTLLKCYGILGRALRQYFGVYAHECADVRICPLDSVVTRDSVHAHMLAYVNANLALPPPGPDKNTSYGDLLKLWLQENFVRVQ